MTSKPTEHDNTEPEEKSKEDKSGDSSDSDSDPNAFENEDNIFQLSQEDELRQQLSNALKQSEEWQEKALRAVAEMENSRRRLEKEKQEFAKYANSGLIKDLIPALDNLARALKILGEEKTDSKVFNSLGEGVSMVEKDIRSIFEKHNVTAITPQAGDPFDPRYHEAMSEVKDNNVPPGNIVFVIEPGYMLFDRLIKPCRVVVNSKNLDQSQHRHNIDVKS